MKRSSARFSDYTEVVIEITAAMLRAKSNLSDIAGGDSRDGIDLIRDLALAWVDADRSLAIMWDGEWIEAVEDYAYEIVKFALLHKDYEARMAAGNIAYDIISRVGNAEQPVAT